MDRGTEILAKLREYQMESLILHKLLSQRVYRLGKRGKWYERLALIQMNYLEKNDAKAVRDQKKCALQTCIDALHDTTVHQSNYKVETYEGNLPSFFFMLYSFFTEYTRTY